MQSTSTKLALLFSLIVASCSSAPIQTGPIVVEKYRADRTTTVNLKTLLNIGATSGVSRVMSDMLIKTSMPCRTMSFSMPDNERVADYITGAYKSELESSGKLDAGSPKVEIIVNRLESDTKRSGSGLWTLDFTYKVGKRSLNVKTTTDFVTASDSRNVCEATASSFENALRANFTKFSEQI